VKAIKAAVAMKNQLQTGISSDLLETEYPAAV
jgi:hypothetical protein